MKKIILIVVIALMSSLAMAEDYCEYDGRSGVCAIQTFLVSRYNAVVETVRISHSYSRSRLGGRLRPYRTLVRFQTHDRKSCRAQVLRAVLGGEMRLTGLRCRQSFSGGALSF